MIDTCDEQIIHDSLVVEIQEELPRVGDMVQLFKALADETRLKIAFSLTLKQELCVCDVGAIIGASNATASHHLRYLKENGLAHSERRGKMVYYSLADDHVLQLVKIAHEHTMEGEKNG
ncbi:metalloregulator ArsR/SmtB family transcription factor [Sporosarcina jeotgali]|uniref:Metalloregulator ArsR/SmtB family transcription factor n=1 Tax=Sporosarcina jeotgali TaxID=3020056 RepID=A0ABZ0KZY6_9BACL|nr:metalloregulator ArsR/SmtB family transcription factor [Sporosarcina sp. B2O-1]WOV85945.1 metalloregulator ArsR/SmtB family transcription factor [Sporosarcina sp. B2O-1]